jgi:hypothetical protein
MMNQQLNTRLFFFAETVENMEPLQRYDEPHYIEDSAATLLSCAMYRRWRKRSDYRTT